MLGAFDGRLDGVVLDVVDGILDGAVLIALDGTLDGTLVGVAGGRLGRDISAATAQSLSATAAPTPLA